MHSTGRRNTQRGFTLMEILVAVAIFAIVFIAALLLYDQNNRIFKQANESAEMQQNTRVAFDKVVSDLRMAGFDYKRAGTPTQGVPTTWKGSIDYNLGTLATPPAPNGHVYRVITAGKSSVAGPASWLTATGAKFTDGTVEWQEAGVPVYEQPDEQIEFVHPSAITLRANLDYNDPTTTDHGREPDLEQSSGFRFPVVTTGNDEIVTYALVSKSGNSKANLDTVSFYADVNDGGTPSRKAYPGGTAEREIKIAGVDFSNQYPPYTLMRYTLLPDGKVQSSALADNIRSMSFTYYQDYAGKEKLEDLDGKEIQSVGGDGKYDPATPGAPVAGRLIRSKVRNVVATVVGMSPQPDFNYTHPSDTVAKNFRQYTLQSTIVGRNLGLKGVPQSDSNPPGPPTIDAYCYGYCGVVFLTWSPAPGSGNQTYNVVYDTSPTGSFTKMLPVGPQTSYSVDLTQLDLTKTYYFRVSATNNGGTTLSDDMVAVDVKNATKPAAPGIAAASGGGGAGDAAAMANKIELTWTAPTTNAPGNKPSCSVGTAPIQTAAAELKGYRIYRSKVSGFNPGDANSTLVLDEDDAGPITDGSGTWKWTDTSVANCENYYYRIAAVEWCADDPNKNTTNDATTGVSDYSAERLGKASSTIKAVAPTNFKVDAVSTCDASSNQCYPVVLTWDKVTKDVDGNNVVVDRYAVKRVKKQGGLTIDTQNFEITNGEPKWVESSPLQEHNPLIPGLKYSYEYTISATYCGVPGNEASLTFPGACTTGADLIGDGGPGTGDSGDPMENVVSIQLIEHPSKPVTSVDVAVDSPPWSSLGPPYLFGYNDIADGLPHKVMFKVSTADCTEILEFYVQNDDPQCNAAITVVNTSGVNNRLDLNIRNTSTSQIDIDDFDIQWAGQTGFSWNTVTLPSGALPAATFTAPQTAASPRTVTFTPTAAADKKIAPGATYKVILNFTGTGIIRGGSVANVRFRYKINASPQIVCDPPLAVCNVSATVTATPVSAGTATYPVTFTNNTSETVTISSFSIAWTGVNKWTWQTLTLPNATTLNVTTAGASGTETFTGLSGQTIPPGGTYQVVMNLKKTGSGSASAPGASAVTTINMNYTTPNSNGTVLQCRVK